MIKMIAKCIAVLAVVARVSASDCGCGQSSIILPSSESNTRSAQMVLVPSGNSGSSFGGSSSGALSRNIVAKGRYPVVLNNCGPTPDQQIPVTSSSITAPVQERPTVRLPASIPAPRTVAHSCTCYKTILRPRVHQQIITVPTVQRYVETGHKPVVENIQYEAVPVNCDRFSSNPSVQFLEVDSGSPSGSVSLVPCSSRCSCGCQSIQVPQVQTVEIPRARVVETVQVPEIRTVSIPQAVSFGCSSQC